MAKSSSPAASLDKFILRLPDGMRERLKNDAEKNGRSLNAEIIARLEESFSHSEEMQRLKLLLNYSRQRELTLSAELVRYKQQEVEERKQQRDSDTRSSNSRIPKDRSIYIALDARGIPISWQEITTHLSQIAKSADLDIQSIDARIFDARLVSNNERENDWWQLIQYYRRLQKKSER